MAELAPEGWYTDPEGQDQLRYWSGSEWTDYRAAPPNAPRAPSRAIVGGLITFILGLFLAAVFAVLALVTANSCGMFGDGCDTYGEPAPGHQVFASGALVACGTSLVGLIVSVSSMTRSRRS